MSTEKITTDEIYAIIEEVSRALGKPLRRKKGSTGEIMIKDSATYRHKKPTSLQNDEAAVYMFLTRDAFLKIGKANKKSNARYTSHHYGFNAPSTLAKSLCVNKIVKLESDAREWILNNTRRINILINCTDKDSKWATGLIEAIMHYKYRPRYEGKHPTTIGN